MKIHEICLVVVILIHTNGHINGHNETNSHFSYINTPKN